MRIELDTPAAAAALRDYLRRCECIVSWAGESALEASPPPRSQKAELAALELEAYDASGRAGAGVHANRAIGPYRRRYFRCRDGAALPCNESCRSESVDSS